MEIIVVLSVIGEMMLVIRVSIFLLSLLPLCPQSRRQLTWVSLQMAGKNTVIDDQEAKHELSEAGLDVARPFYADKNLMTQLVRSVKA